MERVVVSDRALRELVREAIDNTGWSGEGSSPAANVNPIVDPASPVVDPVNPDFTPQSKTEFGIAVNQLVKNLPDTEMPGLYNTVKQALDQRSEKEEIETAQRVALAGGSQEAIDDIKDPKNEGKTMTDTKVEEALRKVIRDQIRSLQEAELPPVKKIPAGVHGGEYMRRLEKTKGDLRKTMGPAIDAYEKPADDDDEVTRGPAKHSHQDVGRLGGMTDVGGASFEQIANEMGMSVAGAKQLVDKALDRAKFVGSMEEDELDILVLTAANDYINMLNKTGELTPADVQLMKDHPDIVRELDGFREFLHNVIRKAKKQGEKAISGDEGSQNVTTFGERYEPGDEISMSHHAPGVGPVKQPAPSAPKSSSPPGNPKGVMKAKGASGKDIQVDWGGFDEGDELSLDEAQPTEPPDEWFDSAPEEPCPECGSTDFESNELPSMMGYGHDTSHVCKNCGWSESSTPISSSRKTSKTHGACKVCGDDMRKDTKGKLYCPFCRREERKELPEAARRGNLLEGIALVHADARGPYLIADGVEARPANPNRTQYRPGAKVRVHRAGKKGVFIVEMPNGETWTNATKKIRG